MSSALVRAAEIKLKKVDWPTQQSFYCEAILVFVKRHVCAVVHSFAVYSRSEMLVGRNG
jgi:hypothetical protein